jgi:FkbM family methyltransferase
MERDGGLADVPTMSPTAPVAPAAPVDTHQLRLAFMKKCGWEPMQILDIGAHKGHWSRAFEVVFPGADIFMIEADSRHERDLKATGFPYHIGPVGREAGTVDFHTLPEESLTQGASIYRENTAIYDESGKTLQLEMLTLDEVVEKMDCDAINFIKLDVQGAEIDVLQGATRVLATHPVDFILAELSLIPYNAGAPLAHQVIAHVAELGFGMHDIFEVHYWEDQLFQLDVLFARKKFLTSSILATR